MASPLEGALAKTIGKALAGMFYDCVVTRYESSDDNPGEPDNEETASTDYPCKGMVDKFSAYEIKNLSIQANDVKIIVLATSLSITPATPDKITIRGATYQIIDAKADPALATWTIQART